MTVTNARLKPFILRDESDLNFYKITDIDGYINFVSKLYNESGYILNIKTKNLIRTHISKFNLPPRISVKAGQPGLHAEVIAVNDIFNQVPSVNITDISVATYKIQDLSGDIFGACANCSSILIGADITTGIKYVD